jgi:putative ABC transport system permease protein
MRSVLHELRYTLRTLGGSPGFTAIALLTLALGIGANTAIFSVVHAVLLQPLPFRQADRLVKIWETNAERKVDQVPTNVPNYLDWRQRSHKLESIAIYRASRRTLLGDGPAERFSSQAVTASYFKVLGIEPVLGRSFLPAEEVVGKHYVMVLSHGFWQRRLGGDPAIVGKKLNMDGIQLEVVGVMPSSFEGLWQGEKPAFWTPLPPQVFEGSRGQTYADVVARLAPGASVQQAQAEMSSIAAELGRQYPQTNAGWGVVLVPLQEQIVGGLRRTLLVIFGCVALVLLIVCVNLANLLLARAVTREREFALRSALGASQWRLIRQMLIENLLLALAGGLLGVLLAEAGIRLLLAFAPSDLPRLHEVRSNAVVLVFAAGLSLLAPLLFGLVPAWRVLRLTLNQAIKEGPGTGASEGQRGRRIRAGLIVSEIALSLILLVGAGLLVRSLLALRRVDPGFEPHNVLVASMDIDQRKYIGASRWITFYQQLTRQLEARPGVESVGAVTALPMRSIGINFEAPYHRVEDPQPLRAEAQKADFRSATPGYLKTLKATLVRGRNFTEADRPDGLRVMIVNESLARKVWPGQNPIGRRLRMFWSDWQVYEVVGLVRDMRYYGIRQEPHPEMFVPHAQIPYAPMNIVIRAAGDPAATVAAVRRTILAIDPAEPPFAITTMEDLVADSIARERFSTALLGAFALLGVVLAAAGLYGLIAYSVSQRRQELAIRCALGAGRKHILRMLLRQGLLLTALGIALGVVASLALAGVLRNLLYGISPTDPMTFMVVTTLLILVTLLATYFPARQAVRLDANWTLRGQ